MFLVAANSIVHDLSYCHSQWHEMSGSCDMSLNGRQIQSEVLWWICTDISEGCCFLSSKLR